MTITMDSTMGANDGWDWSKALLEMPDFELVSMVHKQELAVAGKSKRQRAHWVIRAMKVQR